MLSVVEICKVHRFTIYYSLALFFSMTTNFGFVLFGLTHRPAVYQQLHKSLHLINENPFSDFDQGKIDHFDIPLPRGRYKNHEEWRQGEVQEDQN